MNGKHVRKSIRDDGGITMTLREGLKVLFSLLAILLTIPSLASADDRFSFVALGDMPYGAPETEGPKFERLIAAINKVEPAFTIHVGDIKSGSSLCNETEFTRQRTYMDSFDGALIYTPGDNEWTDCHRKRAGGYDPLERLAKIREMFFNTGDDSLGGQPIKLDRQSVLGEGSDRTFVENQRWQHNGVLFMTAHVVGSNNGFQTDNPEMVAEFYARSGANRSWIEAGFDEAEKTGAKALVLAIHANVFEGGNQWTDWPPHSGFTETMVVFRELAESFGKPVLVVHGDSHIFRIDQPFTSANRERQRETLDNVTRLEVFGAPDVHAVRVLVNPDDPAVFGFVPVYAPGNRAFTKE